MHLPMTKNTPMLSNVLTTPLFGALSEHPFVRTAKGFLFIGDPHVSSRRVGRRKDDYLASVLGKLTDCARVCAEHSLIPVILGDLLHRSDDNSLKMLNQLSRVLKLFPVPPLTLEGNHDKEQTALSDADALTLLAEFGVVQVISAHALVAVFNFDGQAVRLIGCPYGAEIPADVGAFEGKTIMVTHHDMAFGSAYPGALPLTEVAGCDLVVNGHMHDTKKAVKVGTTWWNNPGNIEPLSVDLAGHVPCAWEWRPATAEGVLEPHQLTHGTDLFDLTGLNVEAADSQEAVATLVPEASKFAAELGRQTADGAAKTDDASVMLQDLDEVLKASGVSEATQVLMQAIASKVSKTALEAESQA